MPKTAEECIVKQIDTISPRYPGGNPNITIEEANSNLNEMVAAFHAGKKIYVRFFNNVYKRINSIQRVHSIDTSHYTKYIHCYPENKKTGEISDGYTNKRKSRIAMDRSCAEWLVDYDGPTINWKEKAPPLPKEIIESYDRIGRPMKVGDFVLYKHEYWKTSTIEFGVISNMKNVTRKTTNNITGNTDFTQTTVVTVRRVRLSEDDAPLSSYQDTVIRNHKDIFLLDSNTLNELLIRRLSTE
jgi:hypothetical protein